MVDRLHNMRGTFEKFMLTTYLYKSKGVLHLLADMSPKDIEEFPFDVRRIDWPL